MLAGYLVVWNYNFLLHTNIKHQSLRRSLGPFHAVGPHATNDGTPEVDIENGEDVDQVKDDCNTQEAQAPEPRHNERWSSARYSVYMFKSRVRSRVRYLAALSINVLALATLRVDPDSRDIELCR